MTKRRKRHNPEEIVRKLPDLKSQASARGSMSSAVQVSFSTRSLIHFSRVCDLAHGQRSVV